MSLLAERRRFLQAYRQAGSIPAAAEACGIDPSVHDEWMTDWLYRGAFAEVEAEMRAAQPAAVVPVKRKIGRPKKERTEPPEPKRPRGRPRKQPAPEVEPPITVGGSPDEPAAAEPVKSSEPAPAMVEHTFPGDKGYVKLYVPEGEPAPMAPAEPEKLPKPAPEPEAPLDITLASDAVQRALIDEYGELDRRMQLRATDTARYDSLKRAIKSWFDQAPADADGTCEGEVYLLHLSARERERKFRSLRELVEVIGLDKVLDLAVVPIGAVENLLGKAHVATMTVEARSGSRRIKAIPKRPAAIAQTVNGKAAVE